jgi:hypothetical protein
MVRRIQARAELVAFIDAGEGYLYNDFGGRDPKMCPIHRARCRSLSLMLAVREGKLSVGKLCSAGALPPSRPHLNARGRTSDSAPQRKDSHGCQR